MDSVPESENSNRPETPTADAVEGFLRGVKEIHEKKEEENTLNPEAAKQQAKELYQLEEEIMGGLNGFPLTADEPTYRDKGIVVSRAFTIRNRRTVYVHTRAADLPLNPRQIPSLSIEPLEEEFPSQGVELEKLGIRPKYRFNVELPHNENINFYFDEKGNYLKTSIDPKEKQIDSEELPQLSWGAYKNPYRAIMTAEDFEFVGFALNLIKDRLTKASVG